jgi:hypothetical protein
MTPPLDAVLSLIAGIPAGIALAQGKDGATRAWCGGLLLVVLAIGVRHWVGPLHQVLTTSALSGLAIASVVLGIIAAVRAGNQILATLMVTGTVLLALLQLDLVRA